MLRLGNDTLEIGINTGTGGIELIRAAGGTWSILDRPGGSPFRLLVPLPERRHNYVEGAEQRPSRWRALPDGRGVTFEWDSVRSAHGGEHPIAVTTVVELRERRVVCSIRIANGSDLTVENVHYPQLSDVRRPRPDAAFSAFGASGAGAARTSLWPGYDSAMGFCGVEVPTFANVRANAYGAVGAPATPFLLLEDGEQGLYWGVDEPSAELVVWHGELHPGWADSLDSRAPEGGRVAGHEVTSPFAAVHVPYLRPGEERVLTPVALEHYAGDWHAGADIYAARRRDWMGQAQPPAWAGDPHSWQQIQLNSPEDTLRLRFADLPAVARECVERGVRVLQVVGWNDGGQDRNNPSHDPDPRLGGRDELRSAIAACRAIGVRVVLFTKFVWADRASDRFRTDLVDLAVKDPYGDYYVFPGFRYDTVTQLLDINTRRLVPMCFQSERWLEVCEREFANVVDLGADGMLNDEAFHHAPALLCFDTGHGHRPAAPVYARDGDLVRRLRRHTDGRSPDFLYAAEACYDWLFDAYELSYIRATSSTHVPLSRYLRPHVQIMSAVMGFDDRNTLNQCLLYRYLPSYEPFLFKGRLTDFAQTVEYGQLMNRLRTELREWFWDGRFRDTVGATVTGADGSTHRPYAVYTSARGGAPALVVANYDAAATVTVRTEVTGGPDRYRYRLVDGERWHDAAPHVVLPPRSAAVVVPGRP